MNEVKFLAFSDLHDYPDHVLSDSEWRLRLMQERAEQEKCNFIIQLGDFCHCPAKRKEFIDLYNDYKIPSYHVIGNHDTEENSYEETLKAYRLENGYYYKDINGIRIIVLDANYDRLEDGRIIPYEFGGYYKYGPDASDYMPQSELEWLEKTINESPYMCILFSHSSFECAYTPTRQKDEVRAIIRRANSKKRKVLMCLCGHYHRDHLRIMDNVAYFEVNSATFDCMEKHHFEYPKEMHDKYSWLKCELIYTKPLSAVITVREDGYIDIKGSSAELFMGIDRKKAGNAECDGSGRYTEPKISDAKFKLL